MSIGSSLYDEEGARSEQSQEVRRSIGSGLTASVVLKIAGSQQVSSRISQASMFVWLVSGSS